MGMSSTAPLVTPASPHSGMGASSLDLFENWSRCFGTTSSASTRRGKKTPHNPDATIPAMPFSPSDLPWWGWLLSSVVTLEVAVISWVIFARCHDHQSSATSALGYIALLFTVPAALVGVLTGLMGIVLFVKWVWT